MNKSLGFLTAALLGIASAGCVPNTYVNMGLRSSRDMHPFVSTRAMPVTLTLVDTLTGETVWTLDVPPDQMAVVQLKHEHRYIPSVYGATPADEVRWEVMDLGTRYQKLTHSQKLSGDPVLLKPLFGRTPGEAPPAPAAPTATPAPVPAPTPAAAPAPAPPPPAK